jgi:WD40 repeat protein
MTRAVWIVALLCIQPCALAWQNGKLTFPETAPVPLEIAKLLESKPSPGSAFAPGSDDGAIRYELEYPVTDKRFEATITLIQNGISTVVRNPRVDELYRTLETQNIEFGYSTISSLVFSPDGKKLYVGTFGGGIRVIDTQQSQEIGLLIDPAISSKWAAHSGAINWLWKFENPQRPDQWWLVSSARDATVKIWDGNTGRLVAKAGYSAAIDLIWTREDNELLAAAGNIIYRITPLRFTMIQKFAGLGSAIFSFAKVGNSLWAKAWDSAVMSWNLETSQRQKLYSRIALAAISADGRRLAVKFGDDQIRLLASSGGGLIASFRIFEDRFDKSIDFNRLHLSADGRYLALTKLFSGHLIIESYYTEFAKVWDTNSGKIIFNKEFPGANLDWSRDGRYLLGKGLTYNYRYAVYDFIKQKTVSNYSNLSSNSQSQWASGNITLVGAKEFGDKTILLNLYSAIGEKQLRQLGRISTKKINGLQMMRSLDSKKLALRFWNTLLIWDIEKSKLIASKALVDDSDEQNPSYSLIDFVMRFSDDSKSLLTWDSKSGFGIGHVWNADTLTDEGRADCKKEVLGFLKSPRAVICNDGDQLTMIPFAK